jgi:hypothetical protein
MTARARQERPDNGDRDRVFGSLAILIVTRSRSGEIFYAVF